MRHAYSLYDAKAKLSAIIRWMREGHYVTVTAHGEPVAEIRPFPKAEKDLGARLRELESHRIIVPGEGSPQQLRPIARRRGALKRFLDERD